MQDSIKNSSQIVGSSAKLAEVVELIIKIADTPTNILITGESGTGKELAARLLHDKSSRNRNPFIDINCAAIPETLLESELFGIEKGVATGVEKREGKIELSSGGSLFLDEIGDMSLVAQAKLLRVLQERNLKRVGGKKEIGVDLRIISATNKDLLSEIKKGKFREDLYYRINEVHIRMPSLREIREDIPLFVEHFLNALCDELNMDPMIFSDSAVDSLSNYSWPGNIRELKNEVKRSALLANGKIIEEKDLSPDVLEFFKKKTNKSMMSEGKSLPEAVEQLEIHMIKEALEICKGNRVKASDMLGISRQGLIKKIDRYGIKDYRSGTKRISDRLLQAYKSSFVGREKEIKELKSLIKSKKTDYYVIFVHGIGGIGKTSLVKEVINSLDSKINSILMDCREIEPTETGFLSAFGRELKVKGHKITLQQVIKKLEKTKGRTVLVLDTYEAFGLLDTWLRKVFIPSLPENVITIIVGRHAPNTAWFTSSGLGTLIKSIELEELSSDDSIKFLMLRGLTSEESENIYTFARGHPMALELAAKSVTSEPARKITYKSFPNIIHQLTQDFLLGLNTETRETLESVSIVRRYDDTLLKHLLKENYQARIFDELLELPFISLTGEGCLVHDIVRETIARELSIRDPQRYRGYKKAAWVYLNEQSLMKHGESLWQATADLLYTIENPIVRDAFFPKGAVNYSVEPLSPENEEDVIKITLESEPGKPAQIIENWLKHYPESFSVVKDITGEVEAFFILCEPESVDMDRLSSDPIVNLWYRHLESDPLDSTDKALYLRRWLSKGYGESLCAAQGASWLDVKRSYMELRPNLKRLYTTVVDINTYAPVIIPLGFRPLDDSELILDQATYYSAILDFGPESVDGWLRRLIGVELGISNANH
jgi:DNA-binding NtrC family response regulator